MACSDSALNGWLAMLATMLSAWARIVTKMASAASWAAWPAFWMEDRFFWDNDMELHLLKN
jgi:hypothetical protein